MQTDVTLRTDRVARVTAFCAASPTPLSDPARTSTPLSLDIRFSLSDIFFRTDIAALLGSVPIEEAFRC